MGVGAREKLLRRVAQREKEIERCGAYGSRCLVLGKAITQSCTKNHRGTQREKGKLELGKKYYTKNHNYIEKNIYSL